MESGGGDFERMKEVTAIGTLIFYWSLIVVGVLIGMNIIITILMGGFEKTKEVIDSAAPEWDDFTKEVKSSLLPKSGKLQKLLSIGSAEEEDEDEETEALKIRRSASNQAQKVLSLSAFSDQELSDEIMRRMKERD